MAELQKSSLNEIVQELGNIEKCYTSIWAENLQLQKPLKEIMLIHLPAALKKEGSAGEQVTAILDSLEAIQNKVRALAGESQLIYSQISATKRQLQIRPKGERNCDSGISLLSENRTSHLSVAMNELKTPFSEDHIDKSKIDMLPSIEDKVAQWDDTAESIATSLTSFEERVSPTDSPSVSEEDNETAETYQRDSATFALTQQDMQFLNFQGDKFSRKPLNRRAEVTGDDTAQETDPNTITAKTALTKTDLCTPREADTDDDKTLNVNKRSVHKAASEKCKM